MIAFLGLFSLGALAYVSALDVPPLGDDWQRIFNAFPTYDVGLGEAVSSILPDRPVLMASNWLNYRLFGPDPLSFKVINILLVIATGLAFYRLLLRLGQACFQRHLVFPAWLVSALFVTHPALNHTVNIIVQRGVLLALLFSVLSASSFIDFTERRSRKFHFESLLFLLLAVLSKPFAAAIPFILLLYARFLHRSSWRSAIQSTVPLLICALVPLVIYGALRVNVQSTALPWLDYLSVQTRVVFTYLRIFFAPIELHYIYEFDENPSVWANFTWLAILGHSVLIATGVVSLRKRSLFGFGLLSAYLAFLPESGMFPINYVAFEHRAPFPFLFLLVSVFATLSTVRWSRGRLFASLIPIVAFVFLNNAHSNEINTQEKWIENSLKYNRVNHQFFGQILNELYQLPRYFADPVGFSRRLAEDFASRFPERDDYFLYRQIFGMDAHPAESHPAAIAEMINRLSDGRQHPVDRVTRINANRFLLDKALATTSDDESFFRFVDRLIISQKTTILADPVAYLPFYGQYWIALKFFRERYENKLGSKRALTAEEIGHRRHVLATIERYFSQPLGR